MFDIGYSELLVIAVVALLVVGPRELPQLLRHAGRFMAKARGFAGQFRSGFDAMVREAEMEEMQRKWAAHNQDIMARHPAPSETPALEAPVAETPAPENETPAPAPPTDMPEKPQT